jgi:hypothetical protein
MKKAKRVYNACGHVLISYFFGYIAFFTECDRRIKRGQKQKQCDKCGLFLFSDERKKTDPQYINKYP